MLKNLIVLLLCISFIHAETLCEGIVLFEQTTPDHVPISESERVVFYDLTVPGRSSLLEQKLLNNYVGKPITTPMLKDLRGTILDFYEDQDHPLVEVIIPRQDITMGVIEVKITESVLAKIEVEGECHTSAKLLKNYLGVQENRSIDTGQLRNGLDFINRNPFRKVDLIYSPGKEAHTTDISLLVDDRRPFRLYAGADNEGVPTTGREQCFAGFNCARMFSLDHFFSYQYTATDNFHSFQAHTVQYQAFLPWKNVLNIYGGYSSVHVDLPFPTMKNHGYSYQASGRYVVPLRSSKMYTHEASVGFDFKRTNNTVEFSEVYPALGANVNLSQFAFRYAGTVASKKYELGFEADCLFSPGKMMSDQTDADYQSLRPGAENNWVYVKGLVKYLQKLPRSFYVTCIARGQLSSQNLLPSEQVGLGGFDSVRGYDQRQLNYDSGLILNTEILAPAFPVFSWGSKKRSWKDALQFLAFLDYGYGGNHTPIPGEKKHDYLLGVGPAMRYIFDPWLTARLDLGFKLHKEATFTGGNAMLYFNVMGNF